jgi:hypothetical protein
MASAVFGRRRNVVPRRPRHAIRGVNVKRSGICCLEHIVGCSNTCLVPCCASSYQKTALKRKPRCIDRSSWHKRIKSVAQIPKGRRIHHEQDSHGSWYWVYGNGLLVDDPCPEGGRVCVRRLKNCRPTINQPVPLVERVGARGRWR